MTDQNTPTLQDSSGGADHWLRDSGTHYRELAGWLREIARKMPALQSAAGTAGAREAVRSPSGAISTPDAAGCRAMIGEMPEWTLWAIVGLLAFIMLLPALKR